MLLAACLAVGALAGLLAGLFGVGGGLVIVPALAIMFAALDFPPHLIMHLAIGTSLATIVVTSLSSVQAHHRRGAVQWRTVGALAPGILLGAWAGAALADSLQTDTLRRLFGLFELAVAAHMLRARAPRAQAFAPSMPIYLSAGFVIGGVSAIVGIGGGTLTVPFLVWAGVPMVAAVATSAACGLPIALAGTLGFWWFGLDESALPHGSVGYLYFPAWLAIVSTSVFLAPLGARLAHGLDGLHLKRLFAFLLIAVGLYLLAL